MTTSTPSDRHPPELQIVQKELHTQIIDTSEGLCYDSPTVGASKAKNTPPPTREGLGSSPSLFLWESRTTSIDVMSISNTTRPVAVSR